LDKKPKKHKTKLKVGDLVKVIAGEGKNKAQGKILAIDREKNRVVVEGYNMLTKHIKPGKKRDRQQGGIIHQEGFIHASNVMLIHNGRPTRIGIKRVTEGDKKTKVRIAKSTGDEVKG
jgi:large subunit ribosomal protein L24